MSAPVIQPSFSAGELSPSLYGRTDLSKYHSGVALARNFYVDYRGGLSTRTGTKFIGQCKDSSTANRLIPFQFSTLQTYALLFGNYTMRVIMNGGYVTAPSLYGVTGVTNANPAVVTQTLHGYSTGDMIFVTGIGGMTGLNSRFFTIVKINNNTYSLVDMFGVPVDTTAMPAYTSGGSAVFVYTIVTPYAAADLALLKFSQSADTMTLTHPNYAPMSLTRVAHWTWVLNTISFVPTTPVPKSASASASNAGSTTYNYMVTALSNNGVTESLGSAVATVSSATLSTTSGAKNTISWVGNPGDTLYNIYRQPENIGGAPAAGALFGYIGSVSPAALNTFIDNNIAPDFTRCPPQANNPFAQGSIQSVQVTGGGSLYGAACTLQVTDSTGYGAVLIPVIVGGIINSISVIYGGQNYTNPTVTVLNAAGGSGATFGTPVLSSINNPFCSTYFQQRQVFGGQSIQAQALVFSKTGDYHNLTYSTPDRADDAIEATIASQTVNAIKHLVPLNSLIVLTGSGAWRVDGGTQSDAITPTSINAVPQAYNGCSDVPPIVVNYDVLYVQAKGAIVRDLSYNFYVNVYTGSDISMLSNHLFFGHQIVEWCWAEEPFKVVWAVREDGILLSLTYLKEQEIYGWTRHDTNGLFKSICSISEGNENAVYVVVERLVNGQYLQYVERFASRSWGGDPALGIPADVTKAWCVDAGLQFQPTYPAAILTPASVSGIPVISGVAVVYGGAGYTVPTVSVSDPTGSGATFSVTVVGGVITAITPLTQGSNYTNPVLTINDATGHGAVAAAQLTSPVVMNASSAVFTAGNVGNVLRVNGGFGTVTAYNSTTQVVVNVTNPLTSIWPAASGTWSIAAPVSTVSGLDHLNGQTVSVLADGNVQPSQVVSNGSITISPAATAVTVGLPFVAQMQSLYLDVQEQGTTIQGKRKTINAVTVRTQDTRGLKAGPNFNSLREFKERSTQAMGQAIPLYTGDHRVIIDSAHTVQGQICIQQDQPLPATVLALIPEISVGDT